MRRSNWTRGDNQTVYLVVDELGQNGRVWREAEEETTDLETVIGDLLAGCQGRKERRNDRAEN